MARVRCSRSTTRASRAEASVRLDRYGLYGHAATIRRSVAESGFDDSALTGGTRPRTAAIVAEHATTAENTGNRPQQENDVAAEGH